MIAKKNSFYKSILATIHSLNRNNLINNNN